ncbi:hypothetical protein M427DRAFT_72101 [Gonapodya prolifera JEL478]|uniref:Uncharacterized protein n=1 Tax=Gonapodya prolifera (strain JEL478) TaxID=1344416 RepID=A0A139A654_GONPJ|nr:hypothetical protein M427DRAFT_72101 [Gonapodya prolifera JEL478]|eukprot:KXS12277.1 hypothetical protein M427DRAFT_72101 [Gonapodya prolifera JEL478]
MSDEVPAPLPNIAPVDNLLDLQLWTNGVTLASSLAQVLIVLIFLQEWNVLPSYLKWLGLGSLLSTLFASVSSIASNMNACDTLFVSGCYFYQLGKLLGWLTYLIRIWSLSGRNRSLLVISTCFGAFTMALNLSFCVRITGVRALPRLCAPALATSGTLDSFSDSAGPISMIFFPLYLAVIHVVYLRKFSKSSKLAVRAGMDGAHLKLQSFMNMFGRSVFVLVLEAVLLGAKNFLTGSTNAVLFFIALWGGQVFLDLAYVIYIKSFALDLRRASAGSTSNSDAEAPRKPSKDALLRNKGPGAASAWVPPVVTGFQKVDILGQGGKGMATVDMSRAFKSALDDSEA